MQMLELAQTQEESLLDTPRWWGGRPEHPSSSSTCTTLILVFVYTRNPGA